MADKGPNPEVIKQSIRMDIAKLQANVEGFIYDNLQMEERTGKNTESIAATRATIVDKELKLKELEGSTNG